MQEKGQGGTAEDLPNSK